jgi:hypothetical protein
LGFARPGRPGCDDARADGDAGEKRDLLEYSIADLVAIAYQRGMEGGAIEGEAVDVAPSEDAPECGRGDGGKTIPSQLKAGLGLLAPGSAADCGGLTGELMGACESRVIDRAR